jgi:hypothetical protein
MNKEILKYNANVKTFKELEASYAASNKVDLLIRQKKSSLMEKANEIIMDYDMMIDNFKNIEHNMFGVKIS